MRRADGAVRCPRSAMYVCAVKMMESQFSEVVKLITTAKEKSALSPANFPRLIVCLYSLLLYFDLLTHVHTAARALELQHSSDNMQCFAPCKELVNVCKSNHVHYIGWSCGHLTTFTYQQLLVRHCKGHELKAVQ